MSARNNRPAKRISAATRCVRIVAALLVSAALLLWDAPARAACHLTATPSATLAFGTWLQPSGTSTAIVSTGGATSGTGTFLYGTAAAAKYAFSGNGNCGTLTITVSNGGGATGVTLGSFNLLWNGATIANGASGLALPGTLTIGATATYTSAVTIGAEAPAVSIAFTSSSAGAQTPITETGSIGFDKPISFTKNSDINFGTVSSGVASTYRMSTAGALSVVSGTGKALYGTTTAANITVSGSSTDGITISAGGYSPNNGVMPSNAQCAYNGGAAAACTGITGVAPGTGKTLLVGVDVAADGTQTVGLTAAPTFTISVVYQ
jgi:hypothetical protein